MTFDEAVRVHQQLFPGVNLTTPEGQNTFNAWSASIGHFENVTPAQAIAATKFAGQPDLIAAFAAAAQANPSLTPDDFAVEWANANPNDPRLDDPKFTSTLGLEVDTGASMPAEQVLGNYALDQAAKQIQGDEQRRADADAIIASYGPQFDAARNTIASLFPADGQTQSAALQSELEASNAAAAAQTAALNTQVSSLQANLDGELAAKAAAIGAQVQALTSGLNTFTAAERAAHAAQVESQLQALGAEVEARRGAIQQQLSTIGNAITEHDVAMRAALETELTKLNAAQEPLNAARIQSAQTMAASVNLGAQAQMDAVRADAAAAGYVGGSTGTDMAIARAAIGGRQGAAQVLGDAKVANAIDNAGIARYGANAEFGIAGGTAGATRDLKTFGANENRGLSDYSATGTRNIADFSSAGERSIAGMANTGAFDITRFGAGENRALTDYGATQKRAVGDFGANETRNIADTTAGRNLNFFSQDLNRRLAALSLPSAAIQQEFQIRGMGEDYAQSGFDRAMKNLNYFRTNGATPPGASAFTGNQGVDSGIENFGAALIMGAGDIAKANNYWSKPSATPTSVAPAPMQFSYKFPAVDTSFAGSAKTGGV